MNIAVPPKSNLCSELDLENLIQMYSGTFLHPNHFLLIPILKDLYKIYSAGSATIEGEELVKRRNEIRDQLLRIFDKLQPGSSRSRGKEVK